MKEYIEREAAIAFMNEVEPCICHNPDGAVFTATKDSDMLEFLRSIPAADVVEVVRCGDCKHRVSGNPNCLGRSKDWYCPLGERRNDG